MCHRNYLAASTAPKGEPVVVGTGRNPVAMASNWATWPLPQRQAAQPFPPHSRFLFESDFSPALQAPSDNSEMSRQVTDR